MRANKQNNNYAFIDGSNLHKGVKELGWKLDYKRFRIFLSDRHAVKKAYLFLGFIPKNTGLYADLQSWGYTLIFKPTIPGGNGEIKGNCDSELVLQAVVDFYEKRYDKAILITGDGDFACLASFLKAKNSLRVVLGPNNKKCSLLLKQVAPKITFLRDFKNKLEYRR